MSDRSEDESYSAAAEGEVDPGQPMWFWVSPHGPKQPPRRLEVFACQPCGGTLVPALYRLRHREFHTDEAGMHRWYTTLTVRFERGDHIEMGVLPAKTIVSVQMATPGAPDTTSPAAALPDDIRDLGEMLDSFSLRIECPACGFVEEASPAHPSSFRAPAPAKAARITVVCPKCGASFEVVMS